MTEQNAANTTDMVQCELWTDEELESVPFDYYSSDRKTLLENLIAAYNNNGQIQQLIDTGGFVLVDGRLCVRDNIYVNCNSNGTYLTEYANSHNEECCIKLSISESYVGCEIAPSQIGEEHVDAFIDGDIADIHGVVYKYDVVNYDLLKSRLAKIGKVADRNLMMTNSFRINLQRIIDEQEINEEDLAAGSNVSSRTIRNFLNPDKQYKGSKQAVLGICVGLELEPGEAFELFNKSGFTLDNYSREDLTYKTILSVVMPYWTIEKINSELIELGCTPLGGKK